MSDWNRLNLDDCPEENTPDEDYDEDQEYTQEEFQCDQEDDRDFWEHGYNEP